MSKKALILRILLTVIIGIISPFVALILAVLFTFEGIWGITIILSVLILPLLIPIVWLKKKKFYFFGYLSFVLCFVILLGSQYGIRKYNESITINITPSINVDEYLPFDDNSKIVNVKSKTLNFDTLSKRQLPIIDGAAAAFPVYSAFVNATYPSTTTLRDGVFEYNNTVDGYRKLAKKDIDIFIGAAPSKEQIEFAKKHGTEFEYIQIGYEAFVFFVNKDNPIESLTTEQLKGIYSGEITNWSELGGKREKIVPFQRNAGSGSQSMLIRFMGDTPIAEPTTETTVGGMGGIVEVVADYKNKSTSIGFSFRFYIEGIIKNPDIKLIAIDGVSPSKENIKNGTYPIITPVYAVTYKGNSNENVYKLIEWMRSDEGQYIIEESGYVGIKN